LRDVSRNVSSGEEQGETAVFAGYEKQIRFLYFFFALIRKEEGDKDNG